jgi:MFS family permease
MRFDRLGILLILFIIYVGSTIPTPLYMLYRREFGFSEIVLTLIYAVYVLGSLCALLFFGRLSDQIGRRPVMLAVLIVTAISTLIFIFEDNLAMLFVARLLSGLGVALTTGTLTAWLTEVYPRKQAQRATTLVVATSVLGLGVGPLLAGFLAQFEPLALRLVYYVFLGLLAIAAAILSRLPETVEETQEMSLRPRVGVPAEQRQQFITPAVTAFVTFAVSGFYTALLPSLLANSLLIQSHAVDGAVVFEMFVLGFTAVMLTGGLDSNRLMLTGLGLLIPAVALLISAQRLESLPLLLLATALGGASYSLGFAGSLRVVNEMAPAERRSEMISAFLLFCYAGISVPVIGVGLLTQYLNASLAVLTFGIVLAVMAAAVLPLGVKYASAR